MLQLLTEDVLRVSLDIRTGRDRLVFHQYVHVGMHRVCGVK